MNAPTLRELWTETEERSRQEFLVLPDARHSYGDLISAVRRLCAVFDDHGLEAGDRIAICTEDDFAAVSIFIAALVHGVVPTLLSPQTKRDRGNAILNEIEAGLLLADRSILDDWKSGVPACKVREARQRRWFGIGRADCWPLDAPAPGEANPRLPDDPDRLAYLLFTSGTTASPTGVQITERNLLANLETVGRVIDLRPGDRLFNDMVLAHADGIMQGPMLTLVRGATVIRAGGFRVAGLESWLNTVRRERATHFITVPTVWSMIDRMAAHDDYFEAPELRLLLSCAARLDNRLWDRIEARFGKPLASEYGLTETVVSALYAGSLAEMGARGTLGRPVDCEARVDPAKADAPEEGELLLSGENVFPGYWNNPERNAVTFTADGWLRTGDVVRARSDGSFDLLGRVKSIINSGGLLIRPEEIDEALLGHPGVRDSVTVGIPNEEFGEIAVTAVDLDSNVSEEELYDLARASLEPLKVPKRIIRVDDIPRGLSGKARLEEIRTIVGRQMNGARPAFDGAAGGDLNAQVIKIAARIFVCDPGDLSARSTPDDVEGWDSFNQMGLFLSLEQQFDIRLPARRLSAMQTLGDLVSIVKEEMG